VESSVIDVLADIFPQLKNPIKTEATRALQEAGSIFDKYLFLSFQAAIAFQSIEYLNNIHDYL
jgi:hypothetical protein